MVTCATAVVLTTVETDCRAIGPPAVGVAVGVGATVGVGVGAVVGVETGVGVGVAVGVGTGEGEGVGPGGPPPERGFQPVSTISFGVIAFAMLCHGTTL
jgi:hypothetical protein